MIWIKCTDYLPRKNKWVLVAWHDGKEKRYEVSKLNEAGVWKRFGNRRRSEQPVAWTFLPSYEEDA